MHPVDLSKYTYVPILGVRLAEMRALEELSDQDKTSMLPLISLKPWLGAHNMSSVLAKVESAVGDRACIVDLDEEIDENGIRSVHADFRQLLNSDDGYRNWYNFVEENASYIPCLQLADPNQLAAQVQRISELNRGVVVRLHEETFAFASNIARLFSGLPFENNVHFIIDFRQENRELLNKAAIATGIAEGIRQHIPDCHLSVSASTFPNDFSELVEQDIFERQFHEIFGQAFGLRNVIYCDRASARAFRQTGGGGSACAKN